MNYNSFNHEKEKTLEELKKRKVMVFATSEKNIVTARNVSTIIFNERIYFQTDSSMEKVNQIKKNKNIALCVDNFQIQGIASILGKWNENLEILEKFKEIHGHSFQLYGNMTNEIVIGIDIKKTKIWEYENGKPFIKELDFINKNFIRQEYIIE